MRTNHSQPASRNRTVGSRLPGIVLLASAIPAAWLAFVLVAAVTCDGDDCYGENVGAPLLVAAIVLGGLAVLGLVNLYDAIPEGGRPRFLVRAGWAGVAAAAPLAKGVSAVVSERFCPSGIGCGGDYLVMDFLALFAGAVVFLVVLAAGLVAIRRGRRARRRTASTHHPSWPGP